MSKKSRRRNKKILAALALAGGAAMLGKRGVAQGVSGADKAAFTSDAAYKLPGKATVAADIAQDVVSDAAPARTSNFQTKYTTKRDGAWKSPNQLRLEREAMPGYGVEGPPSILNPYRVPRGSGPRRFKGGGIAKRGTGVALKHGGRVTGIAKRGFGRALMKGKN